MNNSFKIASIAGIMGVVIGSATVGMANSYIQAVLNNDMRVTLNGVVQEFRDETTNEVQYPIIYKDRTYLPLRTVANLVGVGVDWDGNTGTAMLSTNKKEIIVSNVSRVGIKIDNSSFAGELSYTEPFYIEDKNVLDKLKDMINSGKEVTSNEFDWISFESSPTISFYLEDGHVLNVVCNKFANDFVFKISTRYDSSSEGLYVVRNNGNFVDYIYSLYTENYDSVETLSSVYAGGFRSFVYKGKYLVTMFKEPYNSGMNSVIKIFDEEGNEQEYGIYYDEQAYKFSYKIEGDRILISEYVVDEFATGGSMTRCHRVDYEIVEENGKLVRHVINEDFNDFKHTAAT